MHTSCIYTTRVGVESLLKTKLNGENELDIFILSEERSEWGDMPLSQRRNEGRVEIDMPLPEEVRIRQICHVSLILCINYKKTQQSSGILGIYFQIFSSFWGSVFPEYSHKRPRHVPSSFRWMNVPMTPWATLLLLTIHGGSTRKGYLSNIEGI